MRRVLIGILSLVILGLCAYWVAFRYVEKQYERAAEPKLMAEDAITDVSKESKEEPVTEEPVVEVGTIEVLPTVQAEDVPEIQYYLVEEFGFVNIYLPDRKTIYEFTDIRIEELPQTLQDEICTGKGLAGEQELYDFLENYSS